MLKESKAMSINSADYHLYVVQYCIAKLIYAPAAYPFRNYKCWL